MVVRELVSSAKFRAATAVSFLIVETLLSVIRAGDEMVRARDRGVSPRPSVFDAEDALEDAFEDVVVRVLLLRRILIRFMFTVKLTR